VGSAVVLAPIALGAGYFGGWLFAIFWAIAAIAVLWEWTALVAGAGRRLVFSAGAGSLVAAAIIATHGRPVAAMLLVGLGAIAAAIFAPGERRLWVTSGVFYAGVMLLAPLVLRADEQYGFLAVVYLFTIVWTTDILGFFAGRAIGGPKMAPSISPGKTWAGGIAGAIGAMVVVAIGANFVLVGSLASNLAGNMVGNGAVVVIAALLLSVVGQIGDLFESALKRHFGAKDTSHLIPGHGGVMDRLDGFWAAALLGAMIGVMRGGFEAPARGLLIW
jgi:phosphatidate cytidylyltransferase